MFQPKDTDWLNVYKNKAHICFLQKNSLETQRHIQTESEGIEKYSVEIKRKLG